VVSWKFCQSRLGTICKQASHIQCNLQGTSINFQLMYELTCCVSTLSVPTFRLQSHRCYIFAVPQNRITRTPEQCSITQSARRVLLHDGVPAQFSCQVYVWMDCWSRGARLDMEHPWHSWRIHPSWIWYLLFWGHCKSLMYATKVHMQDFL
jgi:hypothetical protein